jgi:drug/metabolite transporter (DMT)-like permease
MEPEDYGILAALALIWGASFLFIKVAVGEMPPVWVGFGRSLAGGLAMVLVLQVSRVRLGGIRRYWRQGLVIGLFNAALPYSLFALGETFISSSLAGILNATLPLWTAAMSPLWIEAEQLQPRQLIGLGLGFAGAVVAAHPTGNLFSGSVLGVVLLLCATLSYAYAGHFSRRAFQDVPPQLTALMQCLFAVLLLLPAAIVFHPRAVPSLPAIGAVLALGVGGTGVAMALAYRLIKRIGASRTSVVTYLLPPSALFWGYVVLHERLSTDVFVALLLVLSGVFLITLRAPRSRSVVLEAEA